MVRTKSYEKIIKDYGTQYVIASPHFRRIPSGTIIDEDKSVKWNREEVERRNKQGRAEAEKAYKLLNHLTEKFYCELSEELHDSFSDIPVEIIKNTVIKVWEHSDRDSEDFSKDIWFALEMIEQALLAYKSMSR